MWFGLGRAGDLLAAGEEVPAAASLAPFHVSEEVQPAVVQVMEPLPQQQDGGLILFTGFPLFVSPFVFPLRPEILF